MLIKEGKGLLCIVILFFSKLFVLLLNYTITMDSQVRSSTLIVILAVKNPLTDKIPLAVGYVSGCVHIQHLEVQQPAVVCPGAKLQVALLYVKGEPAHINVAGALQDAGGDVLAVT